MAALYRRLLLKGTAAAAALACIPRSVKAVFINRMEVRTVEQEDFRFDPRTGMMAWKTGKAQEPYRLDIGGLVGRPVSLRYHELRSLPRVSQVSDFHCVEGWSVGGLRWEGFRFEEIAKRVEPHRDGKFVVFHSLGKTTSRPGGLDHYVECLPLAELLDPRRVCLLALSLNGKPLTHDHGAPLRVVAPYDLGYKGAKFVTRIEFTRERQPGWWTLANPEYGVDAPVPGERLTRGQTS